MSNFRRLQFKMLGNDLETLFLPSAIVVVEGKTDHEFIEKALRISNSESSITVVRAKSDSDIKEKVDTLQKALGDLRTSAYGARLVVVLDSVHGADIRGYLVDRGVDATNIHVWRRNGIEYAMHPPSIVAELFRCAETEVHFIDLSDDDVSYNGIDFKKGTLCSEVCSRLHVGTNHHEDFQALLDHIARVSRGGLKSGLRARTFHAGRSHLRCPDNLRIGLPSGGQTRRSSFPD